MGFRGTTSSSFDSSLGGLRGVYGRAEDLMLRAGRTTRSAPPPPRRVCCAAATARRRRGGGTAAARPLGCQMVGQPQPVHAKAEAAPKRAWRVDGGDAMCVYRVRCLMHFCRCFGAAGAALCAVVNGSPRLGHERASSARLEGWLEEWDQWTYIWTRRIFALVSFMAASLLLRCSCCSLSGVQDRPYSLFWLSLRRSRTSGRDSKRARLN